MDQEELQKLKNELKKKPESKKALKETFKGSFWTFALIAIGFVIFVYLVVLLFDKVIMPSYVHDRPTVIMPKITGMKLSKAQDILNDKGLTYKVTNQQFSRAAPKGTILNQVPKPGTDIKFGRSIYLVLSKGRDSVRVPNILWQDLRKGSVILMRSGLELGDTTYEHSEIYPADTIMEQSIRPGDHVFYGSKIDVTVSKGSENQVEVPQLIGLEYDEVDEILQKAGLEKGAVEFIENESFWPNTVVDQNPKAGEKVPPETKISIKVAIEFPG